MSHHDRILDFLGGQSAPPSPFGSGKRLLFRCSTCDHPWLSDGSHSALRLDPEELATLVEALHADLQALPMATCRFCAFATGSGVFELDEYGRGRGGYGLNFEAPTPPGTHLLGSVLNTSWLARQTSAMPDVVHAPQTAHAVLRWLSQVTFRSPDSLITAEQSRMLADGNTPGHGAAGTAGWRWKGGVFTHDCPPLHCSALIVLAIALPPQEPLDIRLLLQSWALLAALADSGSIAGEKPV